MSKLLTATVLAVAVLTGTASTSMASPWCHWHRWCHGPFHRGPVPFIHHGPRLHRDYILRDHDYAE